MLSYYVVSTPLCYLSNQLGEVNCARGQSSPPPIGSRPRPQSHTSLSEMENSTPIIMIYGYITPKSEWKIVSGISYTLPGNLAEQGGTGAREVRGVMRRDKFRE